MVKIYLDAGHGGKDSGAVGNGLLEKDINLDLVKRVEHILKSKYQNVDINQTRTTDVFLSLSERTIKANKWGADCFISFHVNASTSKLASGFETFIYNGGVTDRTHALQNVLHPEIAKQIGHDAPDRGKNQANFHVLRESLMSAVLLENLFISNAKDASMLKQDSFLSRIAEGTVSGLEKFFGLERIIRPPTDEPPENKPFYQVVAGSFQLRENAEQHLEKLKKDGYNAFIQVRE